MTGRTGCPQERWLVSRKTRLELKYTPNAEREWGHLRKLNDITQEELAGMTGVPIRLIRAYEQRVINTSNAECRTISNIKRGLNISNG